MFAGAVLFNLHALDIKDQIQMLLFELVQEKMVLWKQMQCLEVTAAIVAETLMEMGVQIMTSPEEITWPTVEVTKPATPVPRKRGGKRAAKNKHGIYGELVSDLAPKLPLDNSNQQQSSNSSESAPKKPTMKKVKATKAAETQLLHNDRDDDDDDSQAASHKGLPVQARKCKIQFVI